MPNGAFLKLCGCFLLSDFLGLFGFLVLEEAFVLFVSAELSSSAPDMASRSSVRACGHKNRKVSFIVESNNRHMIKYCCFVA